ncbi:MAG: YggS family pyridoxal phosphate enzyme [Desulfobulbaceae bacterium A2]|nr:MAG: YggS family pyridoxal phosphate enzyme [Desulfobulbaceae bacterium A2]
MLADTLHLLRQQVAEAARRAGRPPEDVTLLAVSKHVSLTLLHKAATAGQTHFGENYLQEARGKIEALPDTLSWHFIGHLQSNKCREAVRLFHCIETVDRPELARSLARHAAEAGKVLPVLVQVNIGMEEQKHGVPPADCPTLLRLLGEHASLRVQGLMTMPPYEDNPEQSRPHFRALRLLAVEMQAQGLLPAGNQLQLSMGMSADFPIAIEEGATIVRVGTALFGPRQPQSHSNEETK